MGARERVGLPHPESWQMSTPRQQLRQTRTELERELKKRDRGRLRDLRDSIREAKRGRRSKLKEVGSSCQTARAANMKRAARARQRLRDSILRMRARAKTLCGVTRGDAHASTLREIEKAVNALQSERQLQGQLTAWTKPTVCAVTGKRKRAERREESDCEVAGNIDDPGLRIVWAHMKHKIKGSPRRTRTEAFLEWAAEHQAQVYEIQEADTVRAVTLLEHEEQKLARELKQTNRYRKKSPAELRVLLADVPF
jgi:hypothetical protein